MTDKPLLVGVGIPSGRAGWHRYFNLSLWQATNPQTDDPTKEPMFMLINECSSSLLQNRHNIIIQAQKARCDRLMWLDDDMVFPSNTIHQLMSHNLPIVAANCTSRTFPVVATAIKDNKRLSSKGRTGLEEVSHVGMAVMLTDIRIYDEIPMPWFAFPWDRSHPGTYMSEDVLFCKLAQKYGYKIFVDHDISNKVGHMGELEFNMEMVE